MIILAKHRLTDDEFLTRFTDAAAKFLDMGLCNAEVKKMLANLEWVQDWVFQPKMMEYAAKLPKGYKRSQGERLGRQRSRGKRSTSLTGVLFLDAGGDLYIRDIFTTWKLNPDGSVYRDPEANRRVYEPAIAVIHDWKRYLAVDVAMEWQRCWRYEREPIPTPFLDAVMEYWHKHGGGINMVGKGMRPLEGGAGALAPGDTPLPPSKEGA